MERKDLISRLKQYEAFLDERIKEEASKLGLSSLWESVPECHVEAYKEAKMKLYKLFSELKN